jgi:hypothetical protein
VPVNSQNAVMTCECSVIALPRILFRRFLPSTYEDRITIGEKGPNFDTLPIDGVARTGAVVGKGRRAGAAAGRCENAEAGRTEQRERPEKAVCATGIAHWNATATGGIVDGIRLVGTRMMIS